MESARVADSKVPSRSNPARFLYSTFAALLILITFLGFQQFYLKGAAYPNHPIAPGAKGVVIAHGVLMTGWMTLFLLQSLLIATRNRSVHMTLGLFGAVLAAAIVVVGWYTPIIAARAEPDVTIWGLDRRHFMAIPLFSIVTFGAFVALAVLFRRRAELHRPMMLLATLSVIAAPADRITGWPQLFGPTLAGHWFGPFFTAILLGVAFLAARLVLNRKFDRPFAVGLVVLAVIFAATMQIAPTATWHRFASYLVGS
jgi:hypothetical protein